MSALNDDCLLEIFGYLNISDLLSVSSVCKQFHSTGHRVLATKLRYIDLSTFSGMGHYFKKPYAVGAMLSLFRQFGNFMNSLAFDIADFGKSPRKTSRILDTVASHCHSLQILALSDFEFSFHTTKFGSSKELFQNLTELTLNNCIITDYDLGHLFEKCDKLSTLSIYSKYTSNLYDVKFLEHLSVLKIVNLKELNIGLVSKYPTNNMLCGNLPEFIQKLGARNQLKTLRISGNRSHVNDDDLYRAILSCKQLTCLVLEPSWSLSDDRAEIIFKCLPNFDKNTLQFRA